MMLLNVKEMSAYLNCHQSTVYRMLKRREMPALKIGDEWRFDPDAIKKWIKKRMENQP